MGEATGDSGGGDHSGAAAGGSQLANIIHRKNQPQINADERGYYRAGSQGLCQNCQCGKKRFNALSDLRSSACICGSFEFSLLVRRGHAGGYGLADADEKICKSERGLGDEVVDA